jgi:biopolymer transport protein ExbD
VKPPEAPTIEELRESQITVAIDENGVIYFQGRRASAKDVEWGVRSLVEGKTTPQGRTVLFRCDRNLPRDKFEPVIEAIAKGGGLIAAVGERKGK